MTLIGALIFSQATQDEFSQTRICLLTQVHLDEKHDLSGFSLSDCTEKSKRKPACQTCQLRARENS